MAHACRARSWAALIALLLLAAPACSGDANPGRNNGRKPGKTDSGQDMFGNPRSPGDGGLAGSDGAVSIDLLLKLVPDNSTLKLQLDKKLATLQFKVTTQDGTAIDAKYRVEDGSFGSIDNHGVFTPSGKRGGTTYIEARVGSTVLRTELTIDIAWEQSGAPADPNASTSSGGYAGVGGEGPGGAPSKSVRTALDSKAKADAALKWLYPYDGTVFPLGLLAPLLMWTEGGAAVADGLALHISGEHFEYHGYFGRPPALANGAALVRHPIPQPVWEAATQTVAGSVLSVELTLAKAGKAYGPITLHFKVASGRLKGTVYYQSYGTNLAKNLGGAVGGDGMFGGATLAIKPGATAPELVAGASGNKAQCRVCHSVSSDGSRMTVEHGDDYGVTSSYDLRNGYTEMGYPDTDRTQLAWIGMTPDGKLGLANGEPLGVVDGDPISQLYNMDTGAVVASTGLMDFVREAAFPAFAHDGSMVAFNFFNGPGNAAIGNGDGKMLVAMDFDLMTHAFGNPQLLYKGDLPAGWPSFSPTGNSVMFEVEIKRGSENSFFHTRYGGRGELWWTNLKTGKAHRLEQANGVDAGKAYLPQSMDNHDMDQTLNYEPTLAPIASGGYAWMVFTSRRLYGNVATIDPWFSDPREHDLTMTPTTKKLWVAAIDLDVTTPEFNVTVGDDPSHPAFYLPGQELLAGNTRGFWVVDPCKTDGKSCESGVECCSGYCQAGDNGGALTCGKKTSDCAKEYDRCETRADCCDPKAACVNHVCTMLSVD